MQQLCCKPLGRGDTEVRVLAQRSCSQVGVVPPAVVRGRNHTHNLPGHRVPQQLLELLDRLQVTPLFDELNDG